MASNCTNMAARAGTGIFASLALAAAGAFAPSAFGGACGTVSGTSDGQIGIQGGFLQECGDDTWAGLAFAINTGGDTVDTLTFVLNTNRAGGDVYITKDAGGCQPDVSETGILATMCCSLEGLPTGETLTLNFTAVATSPDTPTWVVFVGRTGSAGQDEKGNFNGLSFPSHQVARECTDDGEGGCLEPSMPGQGFANLSPGGTGNPGDWTDLDDFGLGTNYTVALSFNAADADVFDCSDFVGACCLFTGECTEGSHPFECLVSENSTYAGDTVSCEAAKCAPLCEFSTPKGPCGLPDAGPCAFPNGSIGCDDAGCCCEVCDVEPACCTFDWDPLCAFIATKVLGCAPEPGQPSDLATGPDEAAEGYLRIGTDDFGSWADPGFGGNAIGDTFNPVGAEGPGSPSFGQWFSVYNQAAGEAEALSTHSGIDGLCTNDESIIRTFTALALNTDTNDDGVDDTRVSEWDLDSASMDTSWVLTQHVFNDTPKGGPLVAIVTFDFVITNNGPAVDFILHRHLDIDSLYGTNNFADDNVGTGTNENKADRFVYQGEEGAPETHITLSSPDGTVYYGGKSGVCPADDEDCSDPLVCPAYDFGSDTEICTNLGTPDCWDNHIAGVGRDENGDSGADVGGDGFIGMEIPVSLPASGVTTVSYMLTYGAKTPGGVPGGKKKDTCPWDLDDNGSVGGTDLLSLLVNWGDYKPCPPFKPADFDQNCSVGATDLLALLVNWGPCPE